MSRGAHRVGSALALGITASAGAQLQRVEAGHADVSELAAPGRLLPSDLREPTDFQAVYRLTRRGPAGEYHSFARASGGITAVFPRSVYVPTAGGLSADIPPGTVFYIGAIPDADDPQPDRARQAFNRVQPVQAGTEPERGILSDEAYRRRRIDELVREAVAGNISTPGA